MGCLHRPRAHLRWFLPVTGDLRVGGRFQLEGNAGGEIIECQPPSRLAVTGSSATAAAAAAIIIVVFAGFATGQLVAF